MLSLDGALFLQACSWFSCARLFLDLPVLVYKLAVIDYACSFWNKVWFQVGAYKLLAFPSGPLGALADGVSRDQGMAAHEAKRI